VRSSWVWEAQHPQAWCRLTHQQQGQYEQQQMMVVMMQAWTGGQVQGSGLKSQASLQMIQDPWGQV
jgi:hypothetical protein